MSCLQRKYVANAEHHKTRAYSQTVSVRGADAKNVVQSTLFGVLQTHIASCTA